jgi:GR25 family glycosyltransferase involved in LPS biosynthesis
MMVVEAPVESIITPGYINGTNGMWNKVFQGGLRRREDFYTDPSGIQIVIVTCSESRKKAMKKQLDALALPYPYTFFDGFTPQTSKEYIVDHYAYAPEYDTTLCCLRSHVGAADYFIRTFPEKKYALFLEDDVLLLKTFASELETVMRLWTSHKDEIDYVSLGYNPGRHEGPHGSLFSDGVLRWGLDCPNGNVWGCMAYIMNRDMATDMASILHQPTTKAVRDAVAKRLMTMPGGRGYIKRHIRVQSDNLRGMLWRQAFVYPMMTVEAPVESLTSPGFVNGTDGLWDKVFREGRRREEFYELVDVDPFADVVKISLEPFCVRF